MKVIVFDTETTGLSPLDNPARFPYTPAGKGEKKAIETKITSPNPEVAFPAWSEWIESWPFIIQISYIVYDLDTDKYSMYNKYVEDLPEGLAEHFLGDPATHYTVRNALIARSKAEPTERAPIRQIIEDFTEVLKQDITLVAHNLQYDFNMLLSEIYRTQVKLGDPAFYQQNSSILVSKPKYCTVCVGEYKSKIQTTSKAGNLYYKKPTLKQLHNKLFGYYPIEESLHDSMIDVVVTTRCFYRMFASPKKGVLCGVGEPDVYLKTMEENPDEINIRHYIERKITPPGVDPRGIGELNLCANTYEAPAVKKGGKRRKSKNKRRRYNKTKRRSYRRA